MSEDYKREVFDIVIAIIIGFVITGSLYGGFYFFLGDELFNGIAIYVCVALIIMMIILVVAGYNFIMCRIELKELDRKYEVGWRRIGKVCSIGISDETDTEKIQELIDFGNSIDGVKIAGYLDKTRATEILGKGHRLFNVRHEHSLYESNPVSIVMFILHDELNSDELAEIYNTTKYSDIFNEVKSSHDMQITIDFDVRVEGGEDWFF